MCVKLEFLLFITMTCFIIVWLGNFSNLKVYKYLLLVDPVKCTRERKRRHEKLNWRQSTKVVSKFFFARLLSRDFITFFFRLLVFFLLRYPFPCIFCSMFGFLILWRLQKNNKRRRILDCVCLCIIVTENS